MKVTILRWEDREGASHMVSGGKSCREEGAGECEGGSGSLWFQTQEPILSQHSVWGPEELAAECSFPGLQTCSHEAFKKLGDLLSPKNSNGIATLPNAVFSSAPHWLSWAVPCCLHTALPWVFPARLWPLKLESLLPYACEVIMNGKSLVWRSLASSCTIPPSRGTLGKKLPIS